MSHSILTCYVYESCPMSAEWAMCKCMKGVVLLPHFTRPCYVYMHYWCCVCLQVQEEIRLPITQGIAGKVATSGTTLTLTNIHVYTMPLYVQTGTMPLYVQTGLAFFLAHLSTKCSVSFHDPFNVRRPCVRPSTISLNNISSKTAYWILTKLHRNDPWVVPYQSCSNRSSWLHK